MPVLRLDRMLSGQGIGSRREIKTMLSKGMVAVNGRRAVSPAIKIDTAKDSVSVDGKAVRYREHVYIMMNKPSGVISASDDPHKETVVDLLPQGLMRPGLFPAGRLDRDTEGFVLITDDGTFAHDILSPKKHVEKEYFAVIDGPLGPDEIERFENGLVVDDGLVCLPARLQVLEGETNGALTDSGSGVESGFRVEVTIHEGKYHQIKRMFTALGREVLYLKRTAMGGLRLDGTLAPGEARELSDDEVALISGQG